MGKLIIKPLPDKLNKFELIGRIESALSGRIKNDNKNYSQCSAFAILDFLNENKLISYALYTEVFTYYQNKYTA